MNRIFISLPLQFSLVLFAVVSALPQQFEHAGIKAYRKENYKEALGLLAAAVKENGFKSDALIWNYLGLAYLQTNDYKNGRKALEKATKLEPDNSNFHANLSYAYFSGRNIKKAQSEADKAVAKDPKNGWAYYMRGSARLWGNKLDDARTDADQMVIVTPTDPRGYVLTSQILMAQLSSKIATDPEESVRENIHFLMDARDVLQKGVEACATSPHKETVSNELESIEAFYNYFSKSPALPTQPESPDPTVTPLNITSKPRASYTDEARMSNVQGTVKVAVLFGADARIQQVLFLKRLGQGLDEQVLKAIREIKFSPKIKDGKPISAVRLMEYSFSIY